jgi:peptidoglycan/LPS O-acetylase OafA/YrhL
VKNQHRLHILDGFRAIAILSVILFHFFSRWIFSENSSLYPYGSSYDFFKYGSLGVRFFFMISGFVILFTLESTDSYKTFWIRRGIRLIPTMVLASLVTVLIFQLFDTHTLFPASHSMANLLPSVTFLPPALINALLHSTGHPYDYVNGSYWSLWPEVQFYFLASTVYYFNKQQFLRNLTIVSLILIFIFWLVTHTGTSNPILTDYFTLPEYLVYFTLGAYLYILYKHHAAKERPSIPVVLALLVFTGIFLYFGVQWQVRIIYAGMLALFFAFIYRPRWLSLLESRLFLQIGVASYAIYLLHENIGVLLIHSWAGYFSPVGFVLPLLLICFFCIVCILYTQTLEKHVADWLKGNLIGKKRITTPRILPGAAEVQPQ